jgi:hypothetical protein
VGKKSVLRSAKIAHWLPTPLTGKPILNGGPQAQATPLGQLPFFIRYLKMGHLFGPWADACPLDYTSNNAPKKANILGSLLLAVLSGRTRYAHITSLMGDSVNAKPLGMAKAASDGCVRRAQLRIGEEDGIRWLQGRLYYCYSPLLSQPWILDMDVTVKPLCGRKALSSVTIRTSLAARRIPTIPT